MRSPTLLEHAEPLRLPEILDAATPVLKVRTGLCVCHLASDAAGEAGLGLNTACARLVSFAHQSSILTKLIATLP